jgi:hypothetical protein
MGLQTLDEHVDFFLLGILLVSLFLLGDDLPTTSVPDDLPDA